MLAIGVWQEKEQSVKHGVQGVDHTYVRSVFKNNNTEPPLTSQGGHSLGVSHYL